VNGLFGFAFSSSNFQDLPLHQFLSKKVQEPPLSKICFCSQTRELWQHVDDQTIKKKLRRLEQLKTGKGMYQFEEHQRFERKIINTNN